MPSPDAEPDLNCGSRCRVCAALRSAVPGAVAQAGIADVTLADIAARAGLDPALARRHARDDLTGVLGSAYLVVVGDLQAEFQAALDGAPTAQAGLERALRGLLARLAVDQDLAIFCCVEMVKGRRELQALREQIRRLSAAAMARQHERASGGSWFPPTHFELVHGALVQVIGTCAREGRMHELPAMADAVLALADPVPRAPDRAVA